MGVKAKFYQDLFERHGYTVVDIQRKGHFHIVARLGKRELKFIAACSPSDHRALKNFEGQIKRAARQLSPST